MVHAATLKTFPSRHSENDVIPSKAKIYYVIIVSVLLALFLAAMVIIGIRGSVSDDQTSVQQYNNAANEGTTENTGAPAAGSGTPADRVNPAPSGSGGNTLLNPEESPSF